MKLCLICFAQNDEKVATCAACGEGSFTANEPVKAPAVMPAVRSIPVAAEPVEAEPFSEPAEEQEAAPAVETPAERHVPRRRR